MQDVQNLNPLQVGVRLLPQAGTGLLLSPLVGCWTHKINNSLVLLAAASCQCGASVLLVWVDKDSNYFAYILPSLILSTLSMDWVRTIGAVGQTPRTHLRYRQAMARLTEIDSNTSSIPSLFMTESWVR